MKLLHEKYLEIALGKRKKPRRSSKIRATVKSSLLKDDRARIFDAIGRLKKKGFSTLGAIRHLRHLGSWTARFGALSDATWRCYYDRRKRHH